MADMKIYKPDTLPAEREVRMPAGTPLGLGILGAARFAAIRRVLDYAAGAATAKANFHNAEAAVASSLVGRERARRQLENIEEICDDDVARFKAGAEIGSLRRRLEKMEVEDQIADREARRDKLRGVSGQPGAKSGGVAKDEFAAFMDDLKRLPEVINAVSSAKEQIIKKAGGTDKLSKSDKAACDMFDAMLQGFMSKRAGETAL